MKDITGQTFGRLTALYNTNTKKHGAYVWHCRCSCGNEVDAPINSLTSGNITSCGCAKRGINAKDITGQTFGYLTALEPTDKRTSGSVVWRCVCVCGKETDVALNNLMWGKVKSCGCKKIIGPRRKDLTGMKYGKLTALYPTEKRYAGSVVWHCKCDCGGEKDVAAAALGSGHARSCGCLATGRKKREVDCG